MSNNFGQFRFIPEENEVHINFIRDNGKLKMAITHEIPIAITEANIIYDLINKHFDDFREAEKKKYNEEIKKKWKEEALKINNGGQEVQGDTLGYDRIPEDMEEEPVLVEVPQKRKHYLIYAIILILILYFLYVVYANVWG